MNLNILEAKEKTKEFLGKTCYSLVRPDFSKYCMIYMFTTENLSYLEKINVQNKDILTVTGSFDQSLNLALEGAKSITNFDVNHLSVYFAKLKLAALNSLSYTEFLDFFSGENALNYNTYLRIKNSLEQPFLEYWDFLYELFSNDGKQLSKCRLFDTPTNLKNIILSNPYLRNEQNYNKTREKIKNVTIDFTDKNLLDIGKEEEEKYDLMLFSNIESYLVDDVFSTMSKEEYLEFIKNQASKQLRENGVIQIAYQYNYRYKPIKQYYESSLKRLLEKTKKVYDKKEYLEDFKKIIFMGYSLRQNIDMSKDVEDCVYLYTKNSKQR